MRKQQGMTLVGMLLTMATIVILAIVVIQVVPVYLQYYSVVHSAKSLNSVPRSSLTGDSLSDVGLLRSSMMKRLEINGLDDLKENELIITPDGTNKFKVHIKYQVVKLLVYNVSLQFNFDDTEEVEPGSES